MTVELKGGGTGSGWPCDMAGVADTATSSASTDNRNVSAMADLRCLGDAGYTTAAISDLAGGARSYRGNCHPSRRPHCSALRIIVAVCWQLAAGG